MNDELLLTICQIKSKAWPYNLESQIKWMKDHLIDEDKHVLLYDEGNVLVAYLNLVAIQFTLNNRVFSGLGLGNVCAADKKKGFGGELIKAANKYLLSSNCICMLFCKRELINFYIKYNWIHVPKENITFLDINENTFETMIFNAHLKIESIVFAGQLF